LQQEDIQETLKLEHQNGEPNSNRSLLVLRGGVAGKGETEQTRANHKNYRR